MGILEVRTGRLHQGFEINGAGVLPGPLGDLEHDGRLFFFARLDDALKHLHVIHIKGAQGIFAFERFGEQVRCMC